MACSRLFHSGFIINPFIRNHHSSSLSQKGNVPQRECCGTFDIVPISTEDLPVLFVLLGFDKCAVPEDVSDVGLGIDHGFDQRCSRSEQRGDAGSVP